MRRDPHDVAADADVDLRCRESRGELCGQPVTEADAEHVLGALLCGCDHIAGGKCALCDFLGEMGDGLLDGGYTPVEDLLKGGGGHGGEDELRELAHVEAARARQEFVAVVSNASEIVAALARQPRLFDG